MKVVKRLCLIINDMLIFLLQYFAINSVHCIDEFPQFYAIDPNNNEDLKDLSLFARLEECPIWNSTTNNLFIHKNPDDKNWYLEQIYNPIVSGCRVKSSDNSQQRQGMMNPSQNSLPMESGWINIDIGQKNKDEISIALFPISVVFWEIGQRGMFSGLNTIFDLPFILDKSDREETVGYQENCVEKALEYYTSKKDYVFVSATKFSNKNEIQCRFKKFSFSRFDSVFLKVEEEEDSKSMFIVLKRKEPRVKTINVKEATEEDLPPFYLIDLENDDYLHVFGRYTSKCVIYNSTDSNMIMYRKKGNGFWHIEIFVGWTFNENNCRIQYEQSNYKVNYKYNETLPQKYGWTDKRNKDINFPLIKFESCEKKVGIRLSSGKSQNNENIYECLELAKKSTMFDFVFVSTKSKIGNNNVDVECKFTRVPLFGDFRNISVELDPDSAFYVMDQNCTFKDTNKDSENTNLMGGIAGGVGLFIIIIIICIIIFVIKKRNPKEQKNEKAIVHRNDLYGNISNQEEHEERYDTNIVDTNQYYEDYDNVELE